MNRQSFQLGESPFKRTLRWFAVLIFSLLATTSAAAEGFRINAGLWLGPLEPELEERFFLDDLLAGTSFGRLNTSWSGPGQVAIYPLGGEYGFRLGKGELIVGLNLFRTSDDVNFTGLTASAAALVTLQDFTIQDGELYAGYAIPLSETMRITPRVGLRTRQVHFKYEILALGSDIVAADLEENRWSSSNRGLFIGFEFYLKMAEKIGLFADFMTSPPLLSFSGGTMEHKRVQGGVTGGAGFLTYEQATAGFEMDLQRITLGLVFMLSDSITLKTGFRREVLRVAYPDYLNFPILIGGSGASSAFSLDEFVTDILLYESSRENTKGTFFVSISLAI